MQRWRIVACVAILAGLAAGTRPAVAQTSTAYLTGRVLNPNGLGVASARVRIVSLDTGIAKETSTNKQGDYFFLGLSPGPYQFTVLASGFATFLNRSLTLRMGRREVYNPILRATAQSETETVTGEPAAIDTARTSSEHSITASQINDLPINRRDYLLFTLLLSKVKPDDTPLAGAIPTSGFDFNGQRARGNEVTIDGVDAVDPSTGGIQATVPQEAVQGFQVEQDNYMPEYGRSTGGVINAVTKSGTNQFHGEVYGFLRNSRIQARNPFSFQINPATGAVTPMKQPYTRVQAGFALGGALPQGKFFYFLSAETLREEATGFSSIGAGNFGLAEATVPCQSGPLLMTASQASFFQNAITAAGGCGSQTGALLAQAESIYGAASATALNGNVANGPTSFPLPVGCAGSGCTSANVVPLPQSYVGLTSLVGNYPTENKTEFGSIRLDRVWTPNQRTFLRFSMTPSYQNGIQLNEPLQNFTEDAGTRASEQHFTDMAGEGQHTMLISNTLLNEIRFQYARRSSHYGFSPLAGGSNVAVNIPGYAFLGREPLSTVDRNQKRFELADNLTWVHGHHTFESGLDANYIRLMAPKNRKQIFNLNYGGVYDFASVSASSVPSPTLSQLGQQLGEALPDFTPVQAYGLGIPQSFLQGIGNSNRPFDDKLLGAFLQDSWQIHSRLTVNFGARYDLALTPMYAPAASSNQLNINQNAESALNVVEGLPRDYQDVSPRLGIAFDPTGSGKAVVRAGYGLFYDVAPLALVYDSAAADGALSTQLQVGSGTATNVAVSPATALQALNAATLFQGVLGGIPTIPATGTAACAPGVPSNLGYVCGQQRFNSALSGSLFADQNYITQGFPLPFLPFTMPVAKNFMNLYAEQGSLSVERQLASNFSLTASYTFVRGLHLYRARNINQANAVLLTQNFVNAMAAGLPSANPLTVQVPLTSPNSCVSSSGTTSFQVIAPGELAQGFTTPNCTGTPFGYIGTPSVFNFFRPSGPNPSFGGANLVGYPQLVALAKLAGFPAGYGVPVAWGDVNQQESTASSLYNGLTLTASKRFSNHYELLSSWTWSHAIDDATDLATIDEPQNNNLPNAERSNSTFDQRQRWVTSAVIESPYTGKQKGFLKSLLANSFAAPIVAYASGRPYTVFTGTDFNLNFNSNTDRPSVVAAGTPGSAASPYIPGVAFSAPTVCAAGIPPAAKPYGCDGNLGRNTFVTPSYFNIDLRLDKTIYWGESRNFEIIAEGFNLLNRFNVLAVNQLCNPLAGSTCSAGQPTAAFSPREFQIAVKFNF